MLPITITLRESKTQRDTVPATNEVLTFSSLSHSLMPETVWTVPWRTLITAKCVTDKHDALVTSVLPPDAATTTILNLRLRWTPTAR